VTPARKAAAEPAAGSTGGRAPLDRLRALCLALPEAHEVVAWGEPTFRVRNKVFAMYASPDTHHGRGRPGVWCKTTSTNQDLLLRADPVRYFFPPYAGKAGWVGVHLDAGPDWDTLAALLEEGWRMTAPKRLVATLDAGAAPHR
jgi:hypothetical protein